MQGGLVHLEPSDRHQPFNMATMANMGFPLPHNRKHTIWSRNHAPNAENRRSRVLSFCVKKWWRPQYTETWLYFIKTSRTDTFLAKMAPQIMHKHTWDEREQINLYPTKTVKAHTPVLDYLGLCTLIYWIWLQTWTRVIVGVDAYGRLSLEIEASWRASFIKQGFPGPGVGGQLRSWKGAALLH